MSSTYTIPREKKSVAEIVHVALKLHPELREVETGEERLIAYVQAAQRNEGLRVRKASTISRVARKARERYPELRGKDWKENQTHAKSNVISQIKANTFGHKNPNNNLEDWQLAGEAI